MKTIDFEVTLENYANDIRKLYSLLRPTANPGEIRCDEFDVGIMNRVVKMDDPSSNDPVVFRIFRMKYLETMTPEEREKDKLNPSATNRALELESVQRASELGITVKLCATFRNGFIYYFVDGDMLTTEIYDFETAKKIAANVAKLHRLDLGAMARPKPANYWFMRREVDPAEVQRECDFFDQKLEEKKREFEVFRVLPTFSETFEELEHIKDILVEKDALGPVCFCHNDLNITNWLITRNSEREPVLLDFEWANTSYQKFDIANHLFSVCHRLLQFFNPGTPTEEFIKNWLRGYYEEASKTNQNVNQMTEQIFEEFINNELKKVLATMLLTRLLMVLISIQFTLKYPDEASIKRGVQYATDVHNDYKANRDKYLPLLDTLRKF